MKSSLAALSLALILLSGPHVSPAAAIRFRLRFPGLHISDSGASQSNSDQASASSHLNLRRRAGGLFDSNGSSGGGSGNEGNHDLIVVLKDDTDSRVHKLRQGKGPEIAAENKAKAAAVAKGLGVIPDRAYGAALYGFSAKGVTPAQKAAIEADPRVLYTEEDAIVHLDPIEMIPNVRQLVALDEGGDFSIDPMEAADDEILQPSPLRQGHRKLATPDFRDRSPLNEAIIGNSQQFTFTIDTSPDLLRTVSFTIVYPNGNTQSFTPSCSGSGVYSCGITISGFSGGTWGWRVYAKDNVKKGGGNSATSPTWDMTYESSGGGSENCLSNDGSGQIVPWGIQRVNPGCVDSESCTNSYTPGDEVAFVLDTGVDIDHPDLNVDVSIGYNTMTGRDGRSLDDGNGHGTHCAGIIGALDNSIGVVGVAPGVTIVPVKVLDSRGSGSWSGIIDGVNHVAAYGKAGDVANMSLGGGFMKSVNDAVIAASSISGVQFALAAGNDSADAKNYSPASANGNKIFTIAASDKCDGFASFSNFGNDVDYIEPGVAVLSLYKNGGTATMSGTSMASPYFAGILLHGYPCNTDGQIYGFDLGCL